MVTRSPMLVTLKLLRQPVDMSFELKRTALWKAQVGKLSGDHSRRYIWNGARAEILFKISEMAALVVGGTLAATVGVSGVDSG
jgi:hypothetical protein